MFADSKYSKVLTVLLIITIVAIVGLLGFFGYSMYREYFTEEDAEKFVANYNNEEGENTPKQDLSNVTNPLNEINSVDMNAIAGSEEKEYTFKGYPVCGTIEIPKTEISYPIISELSNGAIKVAVARQLGPGPNQPGNTVIAGHNYKNNLFFSNNKKLEIGDEIYITDNSKNKVKYIIYNKYETTAEDTDYMQRDTQGAMEISLTTCTDDSKGRLVIWAKAE